MHVGSAVALACTVYMIKEQLDTENYESSGFVLFKAAGVQVDLKLWLPLLIAIPLYLLGQVIASSKSAVAQAKDTTEEEQEEEEEEEEEEEVPAPTVKKSSAKQARSKSPAAKATKKKSARSKSPAKKKSTAKKNALEKETNH